MVRRYQPQLTLFAALLLALPYLTLCGGPAGFTSMARFHIVSFPLFIVMARLTGRRLSPFRRPSRCLPACC